MYLLLFPLPECELHEGGGFACFPTNPQSTEQRTAWWKTEWTEKSMKMERRQLQKSLVVGSGRSWVPCCMTVSFLLWLRSLPFYFILISPGYSSGLFSCGVFFDHSEQKLRRGIGNVESRMGLLGLKDKETLADSSFLVDEILCLTLSVNNHLLIYVRCFAAKS